LAGLIAHELKLKEATWDQMSDFGENVEFQFDVEKMSLISPEAILGAKAQQASIRSAWQNASSDHCHECLKKF
jgi:hypothetical protein